MSIVHSLQTTEFQPATNGASPAFLTEAETSGHRVPVSPDRGSMTLPTEVKLFSADSTIEKFSRKVDPIQRDISRAIAEAVDSVAIPAAWRAAGRVLAKEDYDGHALQEQAVGKGKYGQHVEFFWRQDPDSGMK